MGNKKHRQQKNPRDRLIYRIPIISFIFRVFYSIYKPLPLLEQADYDEYWQCRETRGIDVSGRPRFKVLPQRISDGERVLDIGCGKGSFLARLKKLKPNCDTFGCDISPVAIKMLHDRGLKGCVYDPNLPLRSQIDGDFDCVVLMEVLEHIQNAEKMIQEVLEFKPRRVLITIPNMGYIVNRVRLMFGGRMPLTNVYFHIREHIRFWTVKDFLQWADAMGFEVENVFGIRGDLTLTLASWWPSLFASGVLYELKPKCLSKQS